MRSLRLLLFGLFPLFAISCLIVSEVRQSLVFTGDWRDLSIVGHGYFITLDEEGNREFNRSIRLGLNLESTLCANINGVLCPFDPSLNMPMACDRIEISRTGEVYYMLDGDYQPMIQGTILVARFADGSTTDSNQFIDPEFVSAPMLCEPGQNGAGYLMQNAAFQNCLPLTGKVIVGFVFAIIWLAMVVWVIWKENHCSGFNSISK